MRARAVPRADVEHCVVTDPAGDGPVRIGVLFSTSGTTAVVERTQRRAVEMAVAEINEAGGILGRPLEAIYADPASDPKRYRALGAEMIEREDIRLFFGCYMSSTRKALLPVLEENSALLFYPTLYEGFEFSSWCYYGGAAPNQNSIGLVSYLMENYGSDFYLVGSNYVFPYESNRVMRDYITQEGGRVLQERYIPLVPDASDVARVLEEIKALRPTTILCTIVGDATAMFYRAYADAGLSPSTMPIGSLTTGEPELGAIGAAAAAGHYTAAPYFETIDSPENARFLAAYRRRFGADAPVSAPTEAAYAQVNILAQAIARAQSERIGDIREALPGCVFNAPQGPVRVEAENNHTWLWPRIGRVGRDGRFEIVYEARAAVRPDPYFIGPSNSEWPHSPALGVV